MNKRPYHSWMSLGKMWPYRCLYALTFCRFTPRTPCCIKLNGGKVKWSRRWSNVTNVDQTPHWKAWTASCSLVSFHLYQTMDYLRQSMIKCWKITKIFELCAENRLESIGDSKGNLLQRTRFKFKTQRIVSRMLVLLSRNRCPNTDNTFLIWLETLLSCYRTPWL